MKYRVLKRFQGTTPFQETTRLQAMTLLEIELETGRKHQVRVQMSKLGHPIAGDRKYGSTTPFPKGIALHARRLAFLHPVKHERLELESPLPGAWRKFGL